MSSPAPGSSELSLRERMARKPLRNVSGRSEDLWGYRVAAATVASFIPEELQPFEEEKSQERCKQLLTECYVVSFGNDPTRWSLRLPVRQSMLARLFEQSLLMEALQVNRGIDNSTTQQIFDQSLDLTQPPPLFQPPSTPQPRCCR